MTPIEIIESALAAHGCNPRGGSARCPAHEDSNPSLSYGEGTKRPVTLYCHAGCSTDAVLAALGLRWKDFPMEGSEERRVVATYDYTAATGELLYQVVRYSGKDFRQRRPDGRGGWIWSIKDVPRVLYRLPNVSQVVSRGGQVWIAEGEKDVEALERHGLCATCNSGGAGKWQQSHTDALSGASEVVIVVDRDKAGIDHAYDVAGSLGIAGIPWRAVYPASGKDAADHFAAGHDVDDFMAVDIAAKKAELEADATPVERSANPLTPFFIDWATVWDAPVEESWFVEPFLARGRAHALYAGAKSGKSLLVLAALAARATGKPFLRQPAGPPAVILYIDYEMTTADVLERLDQFGYGPDDDLSNLHYAVLPTIDKLDTRRGGELVLEAAQDVGADFVVIDTMSRATEGDENDSKTYQNFYNETGLLLKNAGIGYLRLDHAGKDADRGQRGSSAKNDDVDIVWKLTRHDLSTMKLTATHRRMMWVPETVDIQIEEEPGPTVFTMTDQDLEPTGTWLFVKALDKAGWPTSGKGYGRRETKQWLVSQGFDPSERAVRAAMRIRKRNASRDIDVVGHSGSVPLDEPSGTPAVRPTLSHLAENSHNPWSEAISSGTATVRPTLSHLASQVGRGDTSLEVSHVPDQGVHELTVDDLPDF